MLPVRVWTGEEAGALRRALRLSVRAYADHLGVAVRTVSKWEQLGAGVQPRPDTQAILDTALDRASPAERLRFQALLAETSPRNGALPGPAETDSWDQETWADDLDRAVVLLSRQNFPAATTLLDRWLNRYAADRLSPKGLYLHARSLVLLGDARRDQGALSGPLSAKPCYSKAHAIFTGLDIPRRAAQIELSLAVLTEMSGGLQPAARTYHHLSSDERLSHRDRARALLWVGTALSKDGDHTPAAQAMARAADQFEELSEAEDWGVAQQKLALAHRGLGDLSRAWHYLDLATTTSGVSDTPLQQVRVSTARAHILLSDAATRQEGLSVLDQAALTAGASGLTHQVRSIQAIRQAAT